MKITKRKTICVVITARPSYARIRSFLLECKRRHEFFDLRIVLSGSAVLERFGDLRSILDQDKLMVDETVHCMIEGTATGNMARSTAFSLIELTSIFERMKPDLVISIADRFETLATSIAASYQNVTIAHIQGGEVTGNIDDKVRNSNTSLADIHFVATEQAKQRVLNMVETADNVFNVGCPSIDLVAEHLALENQNYDPLVNYSSVGPSINFFAEYIVVMLHPVTDEHSHSDSQAALLLSTIDRLNIPTLWFWPNIDHGSDKLSQVLRKYRERNKDTKIQFIKNMHPNDFIHLLNRTSCLVGNSSVGVRECSFIGTPVVNIGSRQKGRERAGNVIDVDFCENQIFEAVNTQRKQIRYQKSTLYGTGSSGTEMCDILEKIFQATSPLKV